MNPIDIECSTCGAQPGHPCRATHTHISRIQDAHTDPMDMR